MYFIKNLADRICFCETSSRQDGKLSQALSGSIQAAAAKGKEIADKNDAIQKLANSQAGNLHEIAEELGNECKVAAIAESEDVTQNFLETIKFTGPSCLTSQYFVYKGLVHMLMGRNVNENQNTLGIIAGTDGAAIEVCLGADVSSILACNELKERWDKLGYDIIGIVAWDDSATAAKYTDAMAQLLSLKETSFLLMVCNSSGDPDTWEFNSESNAGDFTMVDIKSRNKNRRKDMEYKVFHVDRVGVCFEDQAKSAVAKAMEKYLVESMTTDSPDDTCAFWKWTSPPDGYCFWHAVLAGLNDSYRRVARRENGFPVNPRREKAESQAAKNLMMTCVGSADADAMFKNGYVELQQIRDIGLQLNLAIRVTIEDEAGQCMSPVCAHVVAVVAHRIYIYSINIYIYIIIV